LGLLLASLLLALLAWWRFQRREIRVGGEGGWNYANVAAGLLRRRRVPKDGPAGA
jgi:hypothetical protein